MVDNNVRAAHRLRRVNFDQIIEAQRYIRAAEVCDEEPRRWTVPSKDSLTRRGRGVCSQWQHKKRVETEQDWRNHQASNFCLC